MRAAIIERLMCDFSADMSAIAAAHGRDWQSFVDGNSKLAELRKDSVIDIADGVITVRPEHRFVIRAVAAAFDAYIDESQRVHSKAA